MDVPNQSDWLVTLPPPTANGGLHLGHVSGPFLGADVFYKHMRLSGRAVRSTTYSDVNQSYVRVTAARNGADPAEFAAEWSRKIEATLRAFGCDVDEFDVPAAQSDEFVRRFFLDLYDRGILKKRTFTIFVSRRSGRRLDEAGVSGYCPRCLAACKWGICEACAFINNAESLIAPRDTLTGETDLELRSCELMTLELAPLKSRISEVYRSSRIFRPRYLDLVADGLQGTLEDFPITVPGDWGVKVDHPDFEGQVFNAWAEVMARFLWLYGRASAHFSTAPKVVQFFGYDNSYFYAIAHAGLLIASGHEHWLPTGTLINEFYNLNQRKFSTSNGNVLWADDLLQRFTSDGLRFFGAYNTPGFEKSNFVESEMVAFLNDRLVGPWRRLMESLSIAGTGGAARVEASPSVVLIGEAALSRVRRSYTLERFHLRQAAEDLLQWLTFICDGAQAKRLVTGDIAFLLKIFAQALYPITPSAGAELYRAAAGRELGVFDLSPLCVWSAPALELFDFTRGA